MFGDIPSGEIFHVSADQPPRGGHTGIRRVLLDHNGQPKTLLELIREKNSQQGKPPAERADLRFGTGRGGQVFLLNKADGVVRLLVPPPTVAAQRRARCRERQRIDSILRVDLHAQSVITVGTSWRRARQRPQRGYEDVRERMRRPSGNFFAIYREGSVRSLAFDARKSFVYRLIGPRLRALVR